MVRSICYLFFHLALSPLKPWGLQSLLDDLSFRQKYILCSSNFLLFLLYVHTINEESFLLETMQISSSHVNSLHTTLEKYDSPFITSVNIFRTLYHSFNVIRKNLQTKNRKPTLLLKSIMSFFISYPASFKYTTKSQFFYLALKSTSTSKVSWNRSHDVCQCFGIGPQNTVLLCICRNIENSSNSKNQVFVFKVLLSKTEIISHVQYAPSLFLQIYHLASFLKFTWAKHQFWFENVNNVS